MRRMMKNADIEYVGKLQKGTKVYIYPPIIGENGFYLLYDAELTIEGWTDNPEYVDFESHKLLGYIQYSSPLLEENDVILDLEAFVDAEFPETINTYRDLANWVGENLSELDIQIESLGLMGVNNKYIYDGDYELENNQIFFPDGIEEVNGGETFVSIPKILAQNIIGYENEPINIQSSVQITSFNGRLKVQNISSPSNNDVNIDKLYAPKLKTQELSANGTLTIINSTGAVTGILIKNLPTTDPHKADALWNDNGTLKISLG